MEKGEIGKRILAYLKTQKWPSTTEEIARQIGVAWNTAELHLLKLRLDNKVSFKRSGRQNQWQINKN